jgi:uncharacterized membrane protein YozB (DUF420 family)
MMKLLCGNFSPHRKLTFVPCFFSYFSANCSSSGFAFLFCATEMSVGSAGWTAAWSIVFCIAVLQLVCYGAMLYLNRDTEHLKVRGKYVTVYVYLGFVLLYAMILELGFVQYDVSASFTAYLAWLLLTPCILAFIAGPFAIKSMVLAFRFEMASEMLAKASKTSAGKKHLNDKVSSSGAFSVSTESPHTSSHVSTPERKTHFVSSWFIEHRHLASEEFQMICLIGWAFLCTIIPLSTLSSNVSTLMNFVLMGVCVLIVTSLNLWRRQSQDFWGLRTEIKYAAICGLIGMLVFASNVFARSSDVSQAWFQEFLTTTAAITIFSYPVLFLPLRAAHEERKKPNIWLKRNKQRDQSERPSSQEPSQGNDRGHHGHGGKKKNKRVRTQSSGSLETVLQDGVDKEFFVMDHWKLVKLLRNPEFEDLFRKHLAAEFSLENLLFVKQCLELFDCLWVSSNKNSVDLAERLQEATEIETQFLGSSAPMMVNVSFDLRQGAIVGLRSLHEQFTALRGNLTDDQVEDMWNKLMNLFKPVANDVMFMLSLDSFRRFRSTPQFKRFQEKQIHALMASPPDAVPQVEEL